MNGSFRYAGDLFPELTRLQQHLDEVFQSADATNIRALTRGAFPPINVGTSPETVEVVAFAPGVDSKALQITVDRGLLVIAGERVRDAGRRRPGAIRRRFFWADVWWPRQESNLYLPLRRGLFYPLNHGAAA